MVFFLINKLGFCADSFEPGLGMLHSRVLLPKILQFVSTNIVDIKCGKTFTSFLTKRHEVNNTFNLVINVWG